MHEDKNIMQAAVCSFCFVRVFSEKLRSKHCHVPKNPKASRRKDVLWKLAWLSDITYLSFASFINTEHLKMIGFKYNITYI